MFLFLLPIAPLHMDSFHPLPIMGIGACFSFIYLLFLYSTKIGSLPVVSTVNELFMVVTTILGVLLLGETLTPWKLTGMLLTLLGITLIGFKLPTRKKTSLSLLAGVPYALVSAIGTGVYLFATAIASRTDGWFITALFIRIGIALAMFGTLVYRRYNFSSLKKSAPWKILFTAAAIDVAAFSLYNYTIAEYEVSTPTIITASQAAIIALLSWKFLKEKLNRQQLLGLLVVLCGLVSLQLQ